eukprot:TRINITY_DN22551_c0_g1_i1.p1 TRINITY_DN22551_c0_g1~~TRINITY_DN22551_c0_g1_i1.p1  ORF type:complete len:1510 (-),score=387.32 TRINITY_DN22551_c0_g1_i1:105-4634(-)
MDKFQRSLLKVQNTEYPLTKRYRHLTFLHEQSSEEKFNGILWEHYSPVFHTLWGTLQTLNTQAGAKGKTIPLPDLTFICRMIKRLMIVRAEHVRNRWQFHIFRTLVLQLVSRVNDIRIRLLGVDLLFALMNAFRDKNEENVIHLFVYAIDLSYFVDQSLVRRAPGPGLATIQAEEVLHLLAATKETQSEEESLAIVDRLLEFMSNVAPLDFVYWWDLFRKRLAPILFPVVCQRTKLLGEDERTGFREGCPSRILVLMISRLDIWVDNSTFAPALFETKDHLELVLEVYRQGFGMRKESTESVMRCVSRYQMWIYEEEKRPPFIRVEFKKYIRTLILDMSRVYFGEYVDHVICSDVLRTFEHIGAHGSSYMDEETWDFLLNVIMNSIDYLVITFPMNDRLIEDTVETLFLLLFQSGVDRGKENSWYALFNHMTTWLKKLERATIVKKWSSVLLSLTRFLVEDLYDLKHGPSPDPFSTLFTEFDQKRLFYFWDRFIHVIGNPNEISFPAAYSPVIKAIDDCIDMFLLVDRLGPSKLKAGGHRTHPPEGNTLIQIFGDWLFESALRSDEAFVDGRCVAVGALCKVFCHRWVRPLESQSLTAFYEVIASAISSSSPQKVIRAAIVHAANFFTFWNRGCASLVVRFLKCSGIVHRMSEEADTQLREEFVKVIVSTIGIPYSIEEHEFGVLGLGGGCGSASPSEGVAMLGGENPLATPQAGSSTPLSSSIRTENPLARDASRNRMKHAIFDAIRMFVETRNPNLHFESCSMCVQAISSFVLYDLIEMEQMKTTDVDLIKEGITVLMSLCAREDPLGFMAVDSMSTIAYYCPVLWKHVPALVVEVISSLCEHIVMAVVKSESIVNAKGRPEDVLDLVKRGASIYYVLTDLLMSSPVEKLEHSLLVNVLVKALAAGLESGKIDAYVSRKDKKRDRASSLVGIGGVVQASLVGSAAAEYMNIYSSFTSLVEAAHAALSHIMVTWNSFPLMEGRFDMTSSDESEFDDDLNTRAKFFVVNDSTIVSLVDLPASALKHEEVRTRVILRNMCGKYCWEEQLLCSKISPQTDEEVSATKDGHREGDAGDLVDPREIGGVGEDDSALCGEDGELSKMDSQSKEEDRLDVGSTPDGDRGLSPDLDSMEEINPLAGVDDRASVTPIMDPVASACPLRYAVSTDFQTADMLWNLKQHLDKVCESSAAFIAKSLSHSLTEDNGAEAATKEMQSLCSHEEKAIKACFKAAEDFVEISEPGALFGTDSKFSRLFATHIGLFWPGSRHRLRILDDGMKLFRSIIHLDRTASRECHKIGLIYVRSGQEFQREILKNGDASLEYKEFVSGLGWDVSLETHKGFLGGLDPDLTTGKTAPYFCTSLMEVIFHDITRMPTKEGDDQQIQKKRHVGNDVVNIVWSEHCHDFHRNTITSQFNDVLIVVYPVDSRLFRIQIMKKDDIPLFGPLMDGVLVHKQALANAVRITAVNANRMRLYRRDGFKRAYLNRQDRIDEIVSRYALDLSTEGVMNQFFE